jgi:hypothetical protein
LTPAADWDTDDYIEFKSQILAKQDALVEIGTVQFICKHIAELDDDELLEQCILICISLLLGGNAKAQEAFLNYFQDQDEYNRVLNRLKTVLFKEFDQAKTFLQEKNAKLTMIAKTQERQAQSKLRKAMKEAAAANAAAKEEMEKKENEDMFGEGVKHPDQNASNEEAAFDDTLENLMTIDESGAGASIAHEGNGGGEKKDDDKGVENENEQSVKKVVRILRFMQLLVEGHFTPL